MKFIYFKITLLLFPIVLIGQNTHLNYNKFKQLKEEVATPNNYRTASGAPGHEYYQNEANYVMNLTLNDQEQKITGEETITYINNSPDALEYLWLQLDQNLFAKDSDSKLITVEKMEDFRSISSIERRLFDYDGGFKIEEVKALNGADLNYSIKFLYFVLKSTFFGLSLGSKDYFTTDCMIEESSLKEEKNIDFSD